MFGFVDGQAVKATRDLRAGWGFSQTVVRKGSRGIVVGKAGLFGANYRVSFPQGYVDNVPGTHLEPTMISPGSDLHAGFRLGMFIFMVVLPLLAAIRYLVFESGSVSGLSMALPGALIGMVLGLVRFGIHHLGFWGLFVLVAAWWLRARHRRRG